MLSTEASTDCGESVLVRLPRIKKNKKMKKFIKIKPIQIGTGNLIPGTKIVIGKFKKTLPAPTNANGPFAAPVFNWDGTPVSVEKVQAKKTWYRVERIEEYENILLAMQEFYCVAYKMK